MMKSVLGAVAAVALMAGAAQADTNVNTDSDMLVLSTQQLDHVTAAGGMYAKAEAGKKHGKHGKKDNRKKRGNGGTGDNGDNGGDRDDRGKKHGDRDDRGKKHGKKHGKNGNDNGNGDDTLTERELLKGVKGAKATADALADAEGPRKAVTDTFTFTNAQTIVDVDKQTVKNIATSVSSSSSSAK